MVNNVSDAIKITTLQIEQLPNKESSKDPANLRHDMAYLEMVMAALELMRKKEQGQVVELPCKIGDTVYHSNVRNCDHCSQSDYCEEEDLFPGCRMLIVAARPFELSYLNDFGKTVFLTEAEAEAALSTQKGASQK